MSALTLFVLLIGITVGLALVGGLGVLVYRRPALNTPIMVGVAATGVLVAVVVGVFGVAQASAQGGDAGPGATTSPSRH